MVKGPKKGNHGESNPEVEERNRLKKLAYSENLLSDTPTKTFAPLSPSKTVLKHHGKDIVKKSQRKNRYLLSFPGLLAPVTGGKIGELTNLSSKNPILYLDFPQGRMKLFGTIVYPKNRYLTLQFSRGGRNVMCDDCFDTIIVFSDACWVGRKEENPGEARLDFPMELYKPQHAESDFQVRHSERTAGKTFKFAEVSSEEDGTDTASEISEGKDKELDSPDSAVQTHFTGSVQQFTGPPITAQNSQSAMSSSMSKILSPNSHGFVQATISTLSNKVEEKVEDDDDNDIEEFSSSSQGTDGSDEDWEE
ncbi:hypothetical protein Nepgr_019283 [Nepenthes gracilis]|uniref:DNA-binding protein RHL1 n=1 Tax=Nepenthes gracilis TaxID=150966 RepID=A0AAD3XTW7_NEPGR|nr:hypothetical protein Nepgr_019283 [Nepenthes gracilis]